MREYRVCIYTAHLVDNRYVMAHNLSIRDGMLVFVEYVETDTYQHIMHDGKKCRERAVAMYPAGISAVVSVKYPPDTEPA